MAHKVALTKEELSLLNRIASESRNPFWFCICQTKKGEDYVLDLEKGKKISLRTAVQQLMEGIDGMYGLYLEKPDCYVLLQLMLKLM